MKNLLLLVGLVATPFLFTGCQDVLQDIKVQEATSADSKKVTTYSSVNIDLLRVEVSGDTDENSGNWITLPSVTPGLRNLLVTGNATTPLFTSNEFGTGTAKQLRLILGPNSTIVLSDGRVLPLDTPSGQQSGLKVKVNTATVAGRRYSVLVPIDPDWQVVARGNGTYGLKPVLDGRLIYQGIGDDYGNY